MQKDLKTNTKQTGSSHRDSNWCLLTARAASYDPGEEGALSPLGNNPHDSKKRQAVKPFRERAGLDVTVANTQKIESGSAGNVFV
jgi:hypothetical protein